MAMKHFLDDVIIFHFVQDSVDARQLTQEGLLSDTRQLDTRQRDLQDRKPSLQRKRLSWQKGEEIDFMMELLEAI